MGQRCDRSWGPTGVFLKMVFTGAGGEEVAPWLLCHIDWQEVCKLRTLGECIFPRQRQKWIERKAAPAARSPGPISRVPLILQLLLFLFLQSESSPSILPTHFFLPAGLPPFTFQPPHRCWAGHWGCDDDLDNILDLMELTVSRKGWGGKMTCNAVWPYVIGTS